MKLLFLFAVVWAVDGRATHGTCQVGEWSPWVERHAFNAKTESSFPSPTAPAGIDKGRETFSNMMKVKLENAKHRAECKADGSCPELMRKSDEGAFPCENGLINGVIPCDKIDQRAFVSLETMSDDVGVGPGNDIWGWYDPQTRDEYAIMGYNDGTAFFRITDPQNPIALGRLDTHTSASTWRDIKVIKDHAYIVSEASGHGIQIFDLTQLQNLNEYTVFDETAHYGDLSNCHNIVGNEDSEIVYAVGCTGGGNGCSGGLHAVDVSNPLAPTSPGCYGGDGYVHDAQCVIYNGPDTAYSGREICFCYNEDTFTIVDATNKAAMSLISRTGYTNSAYTHQGWVTEDHTLVLLDDEQDEQFGDGIQKTYLWDVTDLDQPTLENTYNSGLNSIDHNQYIIGDLTYQANYETGLRILRIDQEAFTLTEVAYFDVFPSGDNDAFNGAWSVYPYYLSGNVVISSIDFGLYVVTPDMAAIEGATGKETRTEYTRYREILQADSIDSCPALSETRRV